MNWDDMQIILAIGRKGTMSAAGKELKMSHTTISRRLKTMQEDAAIEIFEYQKKKWHLTELGQELFQSAQKIEREMLGVDRRILANDKKLSGPIHFSTVDLLATMSAPHIKSFLLAHPNIALRLSCTHKIINLTKLEADVVLRVQSEPDEDLVGYRLYRIRYAVYAAQSLLEEYGLLDDPSKWTPNSLPWITWLGNAHAFDEEGWMGRHVDPANIVCAIDRPNMMLDYAKQGVGAVLMVVGFCEKEKGMLRLTGLVEESVDLWLLTHEDLRARPRIQAFMGFLQKGLQSNAAMYGGEGISEETRWR